jgi:predicted DNA-binding protein (MmcQ/YjbR family)
MTLEAIQQICNSFPDVTEEIKWGDHLCFCVGGKIFIITSPAESPVTASFKVQPEILNELVEREGFKPAPYLAKHCWVWVDDISRLRTAEWKDLLANAYELVKAKLPKRKSK